LMAGGVDEGPIIYRYKLPHEYTGSGKSIAAFMERQQAVLLAKCADDYLSGTAVATSQNALDGRQYYYMHPEILRRLKRVR
jgi:hypothetical protein